MTELLGRVAKKPTRPHPALSATTDEFIGPATLISVPEKSTRSMGRWLGHAFRELRAKPTRTCVSVLGFWGWYI